MRRCREFNTGEFMKRVFVCAALLLPLLFASCAPKKVSAVGFKMDTVINATLYGVSQSVADEAISRVTQYENMLSKTIEGSDVWRVNHANGQPVSVGEDTMNILKLSAVTSEQSGGAFDITVAPEVALWDFNAEDPKLPDAAKLANAAKLVDYRKVSLSGDTVTIPAGMGIDLGSIAKGYITDRIADYCRSQGVKSGVLNFGGNVVVIGSRPDGQPWNVGIRDPKNPDGDPVYIVKESNCSVTTSGIYERGFTLDGVRYHHILDPKTGWPVQNELASVTLIAPNSFTADAYDTPCLALGLEKGMALAESLPGVEGIFIDKNDKIYLTSGLQAKQ